MRTGDLAAITIATVAAGAAGLAIYSVRGTDYYCPPPSAASVAALFAPCQAFDTAMGHKVTKKEAVQMGLLTPDMQPAEPADMQSAEPAARLAEGSATSEWIDPKFASASMQMSVRLQFGLI
jgi:hypothetical protein